MNWNLWQLVKELHKVLIIGKLINLQAVAISDLQHLIHVFREEQMVLLVRQSDMHERAHNFNFGLINDPDELHMMQSLLDPFFETATQTLVTAAFVEAFVLSKKTLGLRLGLVDQRKVEMAISEKVILSVSAFFLQRCLPGLIALEVFWDRNVRSSFAIDFPEFLESSV